MTERAAARARPAPPGADLATLVETEARLDREVADARARAGALRDEARQRAEVAMAALEAELAHARDQAAAAIEAETRARLRAIAAEAGAEIARLDAITDVDVARLGRVLAAQVAALADDEGAP